MNNLEISDSSTNEAGEANPPPKKKKKSSKDKGYELDFFLGGDNSDKDVHKVYYYKKNGTLTSQKDLLQLIQNLFVGGKQMHLVILF